MAKKQRVVTTVVTLLVAAGVGHVTQYGWLGDTDATLVREAPAPDDGFTPLPSRPDNTLLKVRRPVFPSPTTEAVELVFPAPAKPAREALALPMAQPVRVSAPADAPRYPPADDEINLNGFGIACDATHELTSELGGVLRLRVSLPCDPDVRVDITHAGLSFSVRTDAHGLADVSIPAMTAEAMVSYRVADGDMVTDSLTVPDALAYDRVALSWAGAADLSIHALEFGAGPGSAGHVTRARTAVAGGSDSRGRMIRLGDPSLPDAAQAEVYSFPAGISERSGTIRLAVAARVTEDTCGSALTLTSITRSGGASDPIERRHALPVPECTDVGDILVLKNILDDLKIAGN